MVFVPNNNDGDALRTESSNSFRYFTEDDIKNGVAACDVHSLLSAYSTASEFETEFIPLPQSNLSMSQQKDRISEAQVNAWKSVVKELAKRFMSPKKWKSSGDLMSPSPSPDIFQWVTDQGSYFIEVPSVVSDPLESYQYATIRRRNGRSVLIANRELLRREAPTWTTFKGNAEGALEGEVACCDWSWCCFVSGFMCFFGLMGSEPHLVLRACLLSFSDLKRAKYFTFEVTLRRLILIHLLFMSPDLFFVAQVLLRTPF